MFSLRSLNPDLLGTVLSKLDGKSYLRLQQTRRDIRDRIRRCRAISVSLEGNFFLLLKKSSYYFYTSRNFEGNAFNLEQLYGIRLNTLHGPETGKGFGHLCTILFENRITCRRLFMQMTTCSAEQCEALLAILKPARLFLNSEGSNRYEALLKSGITKNIELRLNPEDLLVAVPHLLASLRKVSIRVVYQYSDAFGSLLTVLQILRSRPFPNLRSFRFSVSWDRRFFSVGEVEEKLHYFRLTAISKKWKTISAAVDLPQVVSQQSSCCGTIEDHTHAITGHIYYKQKVNRDVGQ